MTVVTDCTHWDETGYRVDEDGCCYLCNAAGLRLPAVVLLTRLAESLNAEIKGREWFRLNHGFGIDPFLDHRDAEYHLRAIYRILAGNAPTPGQVVFR